MLLTALGGLFGYGAEMSLETLVKLAQQGDEEAEEQLISSHIPFVKKPLHKYAKDSSIIIRMNSALRSWHFMKRYANTVWDMTLRF